MNQYSNMTPQAMFNPAYMQSMLSNWFQQRKKRKPQDMMTSSGSLDLGFGELNGPGVSDLMGQEDVQQLYNPNPLKGMSKGFGTRFLNTGAFGKRGLNQIAKAGYDSPEAFLQANPYLNQARQQRQDLMAKTQSMMPYTPPPGFIPNRNAR